MKRAWGFAPTVLLAGYCVFAAWAGFLESRAKAPGRGSRWVTTHEETLAPARLLLEGETDVGFVFEPRPRDLVEGGHYYFATQYALAPIRVRYGPPRHRYAIGRLTPGGDRMTRLAEKGIVVVESFPGGFFLLEWRGVER